MDGGANRASGSAAAAQKARIRTKRPMSAALGAGGAGATAGPVGLKQAAMALDQELDELEQSVNVQVRQRESSPPDVVKGRSKLGQLKEQTSGAIREGLEGIKRPLSSLLRRPGSRSGSRDRAEAVTSSIVGGRSSSKEREPQMIRDETEAIGRGANEGEADGGFRPARKTGNWGDETALPAPTRGSGARPGTSFGGRPGSSSGRFGRGNSNVGDSDGQVMVDKFDANFGGGADIGGGATPEIPRLEELQASEFGMTVAQAPSVAVNRVATYKELDGDLMRQAAFSTLEDIDLSLLTKCLCPDDEVREDPVAWTWDYVFTSICTDLRSDWEDGEAEEDDMMGPGEGENEMPTQRMTAIGS